jgi:hypothetical protein
VHGAVEQVVLAAIWLVVAALEGIVGADRPAELVIISAVAFWAQDVHSFTPSSLAMALESTEPWAGMKIWQAHFAQALGRSTYTRQSSFPE